MEQIPDRPSLIGCLIFVTLAGKMCDLSIYVIAIMIDMETHVFAVFYFNFTQGTHIDMLRKYLVPFSVEKYWNWGLLLTWFESQHG